MDLLQQVIHILQGHLLCIICGDWLSSEAMKLSKLLLTERPTTLETKASLQEFFKENVNTKDRSSY